jgi:hypothetical protein
MLIQSGISFQRSMYVVTSAVIQALRTALHYPLDDPNPKHYKRIGIFLKVRWIDLSALKHVCGIFSHRTTGKLDAPALIESAI